MKVKLMALVIVASTLVSGAAFAQYYPQYGTTMPGPDGIWTSQPNMYGRPDLGMTTIGPQGQVCVSQPNIYGQPQSGFTTTCN